jgi:3-isopropylmalate dehydrogenase
MLLDHLGLAAEAAKVEQAVADDIVERLAGWTGRTTHEIGDDIAARVSS